MWNPLKKIQEKIAGKPSADAEPGIPTELAEAAKAGGVPDLKELEKKGMLGKFFRHWKNPAFLAQMKAVAERMAADGVDLKDRKAVQAWVEKHKDEIEAGKITAGGGAKPETFVNTAPGIGRNDPCPCGSGKKYKKCCAAKGA